MGRPGQPLTAISLLLLFLALLSYTTTTAYALDKVPPSAEVTEDNSQVTINDDPTANDTITNLPVTATIFTGTPGPYRCRGRVMLRLDIMPPAEEGILTAPRCYNMPSPAGCANFVANKRDGCEAKLFAESGCRMYTNTAVFIPEARAVGGLWRSLEITCGIPPPDPETLGEAPFADLLKGAKMRPKEGG